MEDWLVYALLDALMAALATILAKVGLSGVDSVTATAVRSVVMMLFTVGFMLVVQGPGLLRTLTSRDVLFIVLSGVAGALSWLLYFMALQKGPTTPVVVVDKSSLLFVVVMSVILLKESLTVKKAVATALMFAAIILLSM
ncbi:EamA family transporter [Thermogladius sp. KZ2Tp1]|uniref:EamA family transporter n=1 Tax=Thermogladius sp. KZ2Tp1 TaxID=3136289 RepID=UPI003DA83E1F